MAQVKKSKFTRAQEILNERTRVPENGTAVDWPYPSPATLVATDTDFAMQSIEQAARNGHAIVLFFPDGEEILLTPSKPQD
jgi:hypothetical protein